MPPSTPMPMPATDQTIAPVVKPSPLVTTVYGEPRFHTEGDVAAVAFAPDGTLYAVDDTGVLLHWTALGQSLDRHYLSDLETLWGFGPSAKLLASGNDDLLLWDVATATLRHRFRRSAWVTAVAFSADGTLLASGHDDGKVRIWNTTDFTCLHEINAHSMPISAIAFQPSGAQIASAGEDRIVRVWNTANEEKLAEFRSHTDRIPALSWSADGSLLVSAGWDTSARVWKLDAADPQMLLNSHSDQVMMLAFAPHGTLLATADSDYDIHLWSDPLQAKVRHVLQGHGDEVRTMAFNADGSRLASAGADRVVHIWDTTTGQLLAGPNPHGRHAIAIRTAAEGQLELASTGGPAFRLWNADTAAELPPSNDGSAYSIAASADGRWLAVGGTDIFTRLYDRTQPGVMRKLEATKPPIGSLSFSPDGKLLAQTSPADGLVWLWDTATGEPKLILIEAADGCTLESVAIHPDGNRVVVGGIDYLSTDDRTGAVCIWTLETNKKEAVFDVGVYAVAIDPQGRYAAGAGINDLVYLWDLGTNEQVFELTGHQDKIHTVAFSPDGSYLLSAGDDQTVRVWDVLSGRLMVAREFDSSVQSLAFSPDGRWLFTGNGNTTAYRVEFRKLLED
jgi:WD40 repeat protein